MKVLDINTFNQIAQTSYKNVKELMYNPPIIKEELNIRNKIVNNPYDLSAVIIIDEIIEGKFDIELNTVTYDDVKEEII